MIMYDHEHYIMEKNIFVIIVYKLSVLLDVTHLEVMRGFI